MLKSQLYYHKVMWLVCFASTSVNECTVQYIQMSAYFASSSLAMRRRMWLVAEAALKISTALWNKQRHKNTFTLLLHYHLHHSRGSNKDEVQYDYLSLVTPTRLSPFTSKIWSPGIRFPIRGQRKVRWWCPVYCGGISSTVCEKNSVVMGNISIFWLL